MPTPLPDNSVTCSAEEKPGSKIRSKISFSLNSEALSLLSKFFSTAFAAIILLSMPFPSSSISMIALDPK